MKKVSIVLVLVIVSSFLLVGCGSNGKNASTTTEAKGTVPSTQQSSEASKAKLSGTIKFLLPDEGVKDEAEVYAAVEKKLKDDGLDFKLDFTYIPYDGYGERQALVVASGEDYDCTWIHINRLPSCIGKGMVEPLTDAIKNYGQDLKANTPDYVFRQVTIKNDIYAIPRVVPMAQNDWASSIRGDLRKKYDVPEIKTMADFEQYLEAIKKNEPNMYPVWIDDIRQLYRAFLPESFYVVMPFGIYIDLTDPNLTVKSLYEYPGYKQICDKLYEWVQKGYMPKDYAAINNDSQAAFVAGKLASCDANVMWPTEKIESVKANNPDAEIEIAFFNPDKPKYVLTSVDNTIAVFTGSKKANEVVALLNWQRANQENYDLFSYGIKDVNYKLVNDSLSYQGIPDDKKYMPVLGWCWNDLRFDRYSEKLDPAYKEVIKNWDKGAIASPLIGFSVDTEPIKNYVGAEETVRTQYNQPLQRGLTKYDTVKDEMLAKHKAGGLDKIIEEVQKQVNAFKAANSK